MLYRAGWLLALLLGVSAVEAADISALPASSAPPPSSPALSSSDWVVTIGADGRGVPKYMGSNSLGAVPIPYFDAHRADSPEKFHAIRDGTGISLFDNGVLAAGPVASMMWQRRQSASPYLNGLGNVGFTGEAGGFIDWWAAPWLRARVEGLEAFGGASGAIANLSMDAVIPLSPALTWSGGPRARAVTSGVESTYFSVTPTQSAASGLPIYNASGGWQAVGAGTQMKYHFNQEWATYGLIEYDKLIGSTASSPIVTGPGGSTNQWTFGVGFTYSFVITGLRL